MLGKRSSGLEAQMGKQHSDSFREDISLKTLSPLRLLRGVICLCILFCTAFMMLVYCGFPSFFVLRFISIRLSRKALNFFFGSWLALWPVLFEKINRTKVVFSGDKVPSKERVLLIANHRTEVDWMYFWDLALRKGSIGSIKYVLKSSLMKLPVFGWGFHIFEFIPVERKWEVDESNLRRMLRSFRDPKEPLWLALFPEGTDYTEQKCLRSKKFAAENDFPVLNNVLLPKTKGFCACLEELRGSLDAVYDVTIGYKSRCPSFLDNVFGSQPSEVHVNIRRVTPEAIPAEDAKIASWLVDTFKLKDRLLSEFYSQGKFSNQETETDLSTVKCVWNCSTVIVFTALCIYLTFFTSIWYTIYVSLASAYLTSVTLFSLYPLPLVEVLKRCV